MDMQLVKNHVLDIEICDTQIFQCPGWKCVIVKLY